MGRNYGLLHVNLNVSDMTRSVRFYTEALGFVIVTDSEETADVGAGPEPLRQVILTVAQTRTILALTHAPSLQVGAPGLNHLGLILESDEDVTDMVQRVPTFGGVVQKEGRRESAGISEEFAYVRDPDGYAVELSTQGILYGELIDKQQSMSVPALLFVLGASGVGKTAAIKALADRRLPGVCCYHFDSIGVPPAEEMVRDYGSGEQWQAAETDRWIGRLAGNPDRAEICVLEGQTRPSFVRPVLRAREVCRDSTLGLHTGGAPETTGWASRAARLGDRQNGLMGCISPGTS
jgi:catechol 2,3-dioxygenase-like lactoylglutathione lyase family enzyme